MTSGGNGAPPPENLVFKRILTTAQNERSPRDLRVTEETETSLALSWISDSCAKAYAVTFSTVFKGKTSIKAPTTKLKLHRSIL